MTGSKYRLGERIGAGGMAEVFRADLMGTQGFKRRVAIKRILPRWSDDPRFAQMFINEAHVMAALRHPNVVTVLDFARDEQQRLCLVMELVEGVPLRRLVSGGAVPLAVAIHIVTELLRGLAYVHAHGYDARRDANGNPQGLVHRDLSASNVFVSWDGTVKLGDFGLAKVYAAGGGGDGANAGAEAADRCGTPHYMSPEQINCAPLDPRSDLFAVGVLLYELLTGSLPFTAESSTELALAILFRPFPPPRELRPEIPADLEALTLQLLERERELRPESAGTVIHALERCGAASHLGRTHLMALLRERFPSSAPDAGHAPAARRPMAPGSARDEDPPAQRPAQQRRPAQERRPGRKTRVRSRQPWAVALLLVLGGVLATMQIRAALDPGPRTDAAQATTSPGDTCTTITAAAPRSAQPASNEMQQLIEPTSKRRMKSPRPLPGAPSPRIRHQAPARLVLPGAARPRFYSKETE